MQGYVNEKEKSSDGFSTQRSTYIDPNFWMSKEPDWKRLFKVYIFIRDISSSDRQDANRNITNCYIKVDYHCLIFFENCEVSGGKIKGKVFMNIVFKPHRLLWILILLKENSFLHQETCRGKDGMQNFYEIRWCSSSKKTLLFF